MSAAAGPSTLTSTGVATSSSAAGKPDRLYVGNLAPTVDEYTLIQVFQKYGKITKLDFMFHKTGAMKGKPRGYAFVEYSNKDDALKAMVKLHDRLLRGRKLVVTYASSAPPSDLPLPTKGRRSAEAPKTTTLSLLKSRQRPTTTAAQIAAMEAKLASMAKRKPEDEDYVPGQGLSGIASGSASPALNSDEEEEEAEVDEAGIGLEEAGKAADELEKELMAELEAGESISTSISPKPQDGPRLPKKPRLDPPDSISTKSIPNSLPPRPDTSIQPPAAVSPAPSSQTSAPSAFQRGLASLPKKPAF